MEVATEAGIAARTRREHRRHDVERWRDERRRHRLHIGRVAFACDVPRPDLDIGLHAIREHVDQVEVADRRGQREDLPFTAVDPVIELRDLCAVVAGSVEIAMRASPPVARLVSVQLPTTKASGALPGLPT
jgi:hypothetical protein